MPGFSLQSLWVQELATCALVNCACHNYPKIVIIDNNNFYLTAIICAGVVSYR